MDIREKDFIVNEVIPFLENHGHMRVDSKTDRLHNGSGFLSGRLGKYYSSSANNSSSWVGCSYCKEFVQEIDILSIKNKVLYVSEVKVDLNQRNLQRAIGQIMMHKYALICIRNMNVRYQIIFSKVSYKKLEYCSNDSFNSVFKKIMNDCNYNNYRYLSDDFIMFMDKALNIEFLVI